MTKKDYIKMANLLKPHVKAWLDGNLNFRSLVHDIARFFGDENPNFDYDRFWTATEIDKLQNKAVRG